MSRISILGVKVDALTIDQAVDRIIQLAGEPGAHYVTKPYVEFIERAFHEPKLMDLLNGAALSLPDGVALQWASTYSAGNLGFWPLVKSLAAIVFHPTSIAKVLPERFAGVDTTWRLLQRCQQQELKVFLIGSPVGSDISNTAAVIQKMLPGIQIAGTASGEIDNRRAQNLYDALISGQANLEPLIKEISDSRADIILTGIGFPQQEALNARLADNLEHGVLIGEGGSFDYESFGGKRRRSPLWMRRAGLEWLWRLILQPSRWQRQLAIPRFIWHIYQSH